MDGRIQELKRDIAQRLRPVTRAIPDEEFEKLVEQMARIQFKYEAIEHDHVIRSALPDPDAGGP